MLWEKIGGVVQQQGGDIPHYVFMVRLHQSFHQVDVKSGFPVNPLSVHNPKDMLNDLCCPCVNVQRRLVFDQSHLLDVE